MRHNYARILAVDLRSRRLGFAAFETTKRLLDFGSSKFDSCRKAQSRMHALLKSFRPSVLVLERKPCRGVNKRRMGLLMRAIRKEARLQSVPIVRLSGNFVQEFRSGHSVSNKYEFAALAATWFPQLAPKVPATHKWYDPEPWVMAWFDALALGIAYIVECDQAAAESFRRPLDGVARK